MLGMERQGEGAVAEGQSTAAAPGQARRRFVKTSLAAGFAAAVSPLNVQALIRTDYWQSPAELVPKLMQRLGLRERLHETEVIDAWSKIVGDFIAAHSTPVALREGVLYVRVLQPALHYELEQVSKIEILRKLKQRFGGKIIRHVRFRVG